MYTSRMHIFSSSYHVSSSVSLGSAAPELQSRPAHCRSRTASLLERGGQFFLFLKAKKNENKATSGMGFLRK